MYNIYLNIYFSVLLKYICKQIHSHSHPNKRRKIFKSCNKSLNYLKQMDSDFRDINSSPKPVQKSKGEEQHRE